MQWASQLLLLLWLCLLHLTVCVVDAWNVGENIPVSVQMRVSWARPRAGVPRDDADDVEDAEDEGHDAKLMERPLPPSQCPRFSINSRVHHPATRLFQYARNTTQGSTQQPGTLAVRFLLGRGLSKSTAWLPLVKRVQRQLPTKATNITDEDWLYLTAIHFNFGYQSGTFNRLTTFRAEETYSAVRHDEVELRYHWDEQRAYNPHQALSLCASTAVIASFIVLHMMLLRAGRYTKQFRTKQIVVHNHKQ